MNQNKKSPKKIVFLAIFLLILNIFLIIGCSDLHSTSGLPIENIDMTPRQVSVVNGTTTSEIVKNVSPAIVGIYSKLARGNAVGSGVAIRAGGYILTNQHVVNATRGLVLYLADKSTISADVLWQDPSMDLAVIKASKDLPYLPCETNLPDVGEDILAIGTPLSLAFQHTVTKGIISALNRTLEIQNENGSLSYMQDLIQHDASINPGNSGGPIINMSGKVIGINTLKASDAEGMGFAIPISAGEIVTKRLSIDNSYTSPSIDITAIQTRLANYQEIKTDKDGLFIISSNHKSFLPNDVIYKVDEKNISSLLELKNYLNTKSVGDEITVYLYRNGKSSDFKYILK